MGFAFNPFTGNFDLKGSGGGGASYIDGEVQNFSALPTANPPAVDSAYLVREPEGTWLINRKPAGIYIRVATTGTRATDWTYAGILPDVFNDANFLLYDNGDSSKNLAFQLSGITTGTTRTLTVPNASGTIALTSDFAAPPAIGNTTPAAGTFTTLTANNGTLTASAPVLNLAQTWNNAATTFTALRINVTNTASSSSSLLIDATSDGGTQYFRVRRDGQIQASRSSATVDAIFVAQGRINCAGNVSSNNHTVMDSVGFNLSSDRSILWSSTTSYGGTPDLILLRDAANTLGQRNGTNAQTFNIYNTFTSATNHERGFLRWSSNVFQIGTEKGSGGGTARALALQTDGTTRMTVGTDGFVGIGVTAERPLHIQGSAAFVRVDRVSTFGPALLLTRMTTAPTVDSSWLFGPTTNIAGVTNDDFAIIDFGTATTGTSGTQRLTISKSTGQLTVNGNLNLSTKDLVTDTTTGTKIGTGTTQRIGFFNATPAVQPAAVADSTDTTNVATQLNALLARLRTLGLIAT